MSKVELHINSGGQGFWLPKELHFDGYGDGVVEVEVARRGESIVLTPKPPPPGDSPQAGRQAQAQSQSQAQSLGASGESALDMISKWSHPPGIADIDFDSLLPPRGYIEPRPSEAADVPD